MHQFPSLCLLHLFTNLFPCFPVTTFLLPVFNSCPVQVSKILFSHFNLGLPLLLLPHHQHRITKEVIKLFSINLVILVIWLIPHIITQVHTTFELYFQFYQLVRSTASQSEDRKKGVHMYVYANRRELRHIFKQLIGYYSTSDEITTLIHVSANFNHKGK